MEIKTPTDFIRFLNGTCKIWSVEKNQLKDLKTKKHYGVQSTSYKRYYAAKTAGIDIDLVINVPYTTEITPDDAIVIENKRYQIVQLQRVRKTNPPIVVLSLKYMGVIK